MGKAVDTTWLGMTVGVAVVVPVKRGVSPTKRPAAFLGLFLLTFISAELVSIGLWHLYAWWDASRRHHAYLSLDS